MGLAVWYRSFIPHLASIAAPLFDLVSCKRKFVWSDEAASAMLQIQQLVANAPVLARWEYGRETRVISDASKVGVGAVLEQKHDENWRPIAFWSRKLKDAETRYCTTDLEWLAAVTAVTRVWYWMLEAQPFTICSDHKALERKLCKSAHDPPINDRQARWIESMLKYPYTFQWIQGVANPVADGLSRYPASANSVTVISALLAGIWKRLLMAAHHDDEYGKLLKLAEDPDTNYTLWHGVVVDEKGRILVPNDPELRTLLLSENHDGSLAGHFGSEKTLELVQRYWTWSGVAKDVREYVRSCVECQRHKHLTRTSPGELHPIIAKRPWQLVTMDFVTGLPPAVRTKHTAILVMVDKFSKYTNLEGCSEGMSAQDTARIVMRRIVAQHGIPQVIISDRGPQFASKMWEAILQALGTKVALASAHHPQTDGQSERAIQTLSRLLRSYTSKVPTEWEEHLPMIQFAMNNAPSSAARYSPFQILYGISPIVPVDLCYETGRPPDEDGKDAAPTQEQVTSQWFRQWWKARRKINAFVAANLQHCAEVTKRQYDKKHPALELEEGDLVLLSTKSYMPTEGVRKHRPRYTGPYVVKRRVHVNAYELAGLPEMVPSTQNVQFLRIFYPTPSRFSSRPTPGYAIPLKRGTHLEWEVEAIIDHRQVVGGIQYKIKWVNHPESSWLRVRNLQGCQQLLRTYQQEHNLPLSFWSDDSSSLPSAQTDQDDTPTTDPTEQRNAMDAAPTQSTDPPTNHSMPGPMTRARTRLACGGHQPNGDSGSQPTASAH